MIIDTPKQGFGNTNDGNTARRFFADTVLTAEITKVDYELIRRFKVILNALSSTREIDPDKFHKYASDTADIYLKNYGSWRTMSSTVHKVSSDPAISSLRMIEKKQSYEEEDADFLQLLENRAENLRADIVRL